MVINEDLEKERGKLSKELALLLHDKKVGKLVLSTVYVKIIIRFFLDLCKRKKKIFDCL